jgi:hypothetical protein
MRWYQIDILNGPGWAHWNSWPNDRNDPGALQVSFEIHEFNPTLLTEQGATLTVEGVAWEWIGQSNNLVGSTIDIHGGMKPGFPLATVQQHEPSLLLRGQIKRLWGNWVGTEMSLGFVIITGGGEPGDGGGGASAPGGGGANGGGGGGDGAATQGSSFRRVGPRSLNMRTGKRLGRSAGMHLRNPDVEPYDDGGGGSFGADFGGFSGGSANVGGVLSSFFGGGGSYQQPLNLVHHMMPGTNLSDAITETLSRAFPNANIETAISPALKLPYIDSHMAQSMSQYTTYMQQLSQSILKQKGYGGVNFTAVGNTIRVWDGTQQPYQNVHLSMYDLIGQPTWIDQRLIQVKTILRGDIKAGDSITLPPTLMGLTSGAIWLGLKPSEQRTNLSFTGTFQVLKVLHVGDFRNPDGAAAWFTQYEASLEGGDVATAALGDAVTQSSAAQSPETLPVQQPPDKQPEATPPQQKGSVVRRSVRRYY